MYRVNIYFVDGMGKIHVKNQNIRNFDFSLIPFHQIVTVNVEDENANKVLILGVWDKACVCKNMVMESIKTVTFKGVVGKAAWVKETSYLDSDIYLGPLRNVIGIMTMVKKNSHVSTWRMRRMVQKYAMKNGMKCYSNVLIME